MHPIILIIEDNHAIRRFLKTSLVSQGYDYFEANTAQEGLRLTREIKPNLILLDLGLPDGDGIDIIKEIRTFTAIPIIILSARDQIIDKVTALDIGADDYLTKPFSIAELTARLRVALRHGVLVEANETQLFESGQLKIDLINHCVLIAGKQLMVSPIQFSILAVLVRHANKVVTHTQLLKAVWGEQCKENIEYLRIYIHQLRHKIEKNPASPQILKTEPGVGYRLLGPSLE